MKRMNWWAALAAVVLSVSLLLPVETAAEDLPPVPGTATEQDSETEKKLTKEEEAKKIAEWFGSQLTEREKVYYDALKKAEDLSVYSKDYGLYVPIEIGTYSAPGFTESEILDGTYGENPNFQKLQNTVQNEVYRAMSAFEYDYPENFWIHGAGFAISLNYGLGVPRFM